jgi:hypothetical protein
MNADSDQGIDFAFMDGTRSFCHWLLTETDRRPD